MKITVDRDRCSSIGMCEGLAPDFFEVSNDGKLHILNPGPPECHRALIEDAVASCPTGALALHD
ncbi:MULTISPECIES: ferredoxin [Mycobacteriaceae]|jgi:ferredoxin|uniref:Ferredoxin n=6 Tax=Mycobacterium TaxID=1763 RepID=A0A557XGL6_9MYCO|nr:MULTISPECIES: ferredoxin [Mycobacteriaceae]PJE18626.1 MAG: ferredoxin [Mycobacterium sp.]APT13486.1 ferredoxin [Mycobacterium avium subsp. hominissuis]ARV84928.1 ferredoxin [Mycobacterium intracellulare subsp. chimaera]ASL07711.1 ferredoxin [Mycobacterium intracellulare subsp. chimaera]ASL13365.1 ferredoxin [Mycobacterium intracellulare subsp. chimaera]